MSIPGPITLNPTSFAQNAVGPLQISGPNLDQSCQVWINGTNIPNPSYNPANGQITAQVTMALTASAPASLPVYVTNKDGSSPDGVFLGVTQPGAGSVAAALAAAPLNIGILSSIQFTGTDFDRWFRLGLGLAPARWTYVLRENQKYDQGTLNGAATYLATHSDVIVTLGGNITALAMAAALDANNPNEVKFFSVIGNLTSTLSGSDDLYGGVNLDTVARNAARFNHLTRDLNIPASQICFLTNPGSAMYSSELQQWNALNQNSTIYYFNPLTVTDVQTGFNQQFQAFARDGALSIMLISADPSFQQYKNELIRAANGVNKKVCYPLQTYNNTSGTQPTPGRFVMHGPKLARACFFLGRDVADFLINGDNEGYTKPGLRTPPILIDAGDDQS
jgi:hypothetical protein